MKINFESDFDVILRLKACDGDNCTNIGWPLYDWTAKFYTNDREHTYVASSLGGVLTNCFDDNGQIHVVFNNHGLSAGTLKVKFSAEIPNDIYPDGKKLEVYPQPLNVELVRGMGDCGIVKTEAIAPTQKWRSRDSLTGIVLRRGFMSNLSQPGEVYCGTINQTNQEPHYEIKIRFPNDYSEVDITQIFGKLFQPDDILHVHNGTYEIVNGRVIVRANEDKQPWEPVFLALNKMTGLKYLTKNSRGQIVLAQRNSYDYRKASPTTPYPHIAYISADTRASDSYYYAYDDNGHRYEWQYRKSRRINQHLNEDGVLVFTKVKRWRHIKKLKKDSFNAVYRKSCVFRIRRVSYKAKGDWHYGYLRPTKFNAVSLVWITKNG